MAASVDCFLTLASPWAYLGHRTLAAIASRYQARLRFRPFDFARIAPLTGAVEVRDTPPSRQAYEEEDLDRWRRRLNVPFCPRPRFHPPVTLQLASHAVISAQRLGYDAAPLVEAILTAVWAEDRDVAEPATLLAIADGCGLDAERLFDPATLAPVREAYETNTRDALLAGVFASPTCVHRGLRYAGIDRLDFLDRALAEPGAAPQPDAPASTRG